MAEEMVRLSGLILLLSLLLAPLASPPAIGEGSGEGVLVIYFRAQVVYDSGDLNACGVNYVVKPNLKLVDLVSDSKDARLGEPSLVAKAVEALRSSIEEALKRGNATGRVFAGSMPIGGGRILFALVSVPESSDIASLARLLGQAAGRVEALINASVTVVLQVIPDDLFKPVNLSELRNAVEAARSAIVEAIEVASDNREPESGEVAVLAEALKRLIGGDKFIMRIEWPEPELGDPLYVSIDLTVTSASITKEAVEDVIKAIRGVIGCEYPLVLGLADFPIVQTLSLIVNGSDTSKIPGDGGEDQANEIPEETSGARASEALTPPTAAKPATEPSEPVTKAPGEAEPGATDGRAGGNRLAAAIAAVTLIPAAAATWMLKRYKARGA